ncbi:MAG TPA: hypothetical protein VLW48_00420 [Candidatus Bathyarchaeia archaeon]|nr:hypothetical protein [Candidatus Bathyarchaeia archaeon]
MRTASAWLVLTAASAIAFAQTEPTPITASAVWQPGGNFLTQAHAACDKVSPSQKFGDCVVSQMSKAGAPAPAVSFTREVFKQTGGEVGIMAGFQKVGPVDIAWVSYPLRSRYGLLLVNGKPRILNAEDLKLLDQKGMQQSFQFQDLQNQFPQVNVWPGDRDGRTWPNSQTGPNGGLQFIIGYPLRNGCQTCANAGFALFTWNFNPGGKFVGTSFQGMTPAPLQQPSSASQ